jgi:hypothetical protein
MFRFFRAAVGPIFVGFATYALIISPAIAQTGTASIAGTVLDAKTLKPIPGALVIVNFQGMPPLAKNTKTGGAGEFQIQGLPAGKYALCVQAAGDSYLDPCAWGATPSTVTLTAAQAATGVSLKLTAASILHIQVQDPQKAMTQKTKDGRRPDLTLGVWGPKGLFYPAHGPGSPAAAGTAPGPASYGYQLAVPRDTALNFHISSHDLKLGDGNGVALPSNASLQAFQHATGDSNPKSFAFTVLGLLP